MSQRKNTLLHGPGRKSEANLYKIPRGLSTRIYSCRSYYLRMTDHLWINYQVICNSYRFLYSNALSNRQPRTFPEWAGDSEWRYGMTKKKSAENHKSMELFSALYFLACTSPFKRLIRISNEKLNNTSIINLLQTNLKCIKKNTHGIFLLKLHRFFPTGSFAGNQQLFVFRVRLPLCFFLILIYFTYLNWRPVPACLLGPSTAWRTESRQLWGFSTQPQAFPFFPLKTLRVKKIGYLPVGEISREIRAWAYCSIPPQNDSQEAAKFLSAERKGSWHYGHRRWFLRGPPTSPRPVTWWQHVGLVPKLFRQISLLMSRTIH